MEDQRWVKSNISRLTGELQGAASLAEFGDRLLSGLVPMVGGGIAGFDDLLSFFKLLPNMNKQFSVMQGISHASFQQKNYLMVYHILHAYFTQPAPAYTG